ncbi:MULTISPECIES: hypothetical protein [unclassified Shewanella]|uniref:hypothetical protein n=1 Tax=unclassified Shewanella TaxID=196818 RepID=UPI0021DAE293|nr:MULTISPECIES: hypothetical protein [unclassified Shewanella]MCU8035048.1 hypothetical protein [Shewanella sp. SM71]MCU8096918.1 hypothetical protein [Shewanella sp. SM102]
MYFSQIEALIKNDWRGDNSLKIVLLVFEYFKKRALRNDYSNIGFHQIYHEAIKNGVVQLGCEDEVKIIINYLLDKHIEFLKVNYFLVDDGLWHPLSVEELLDAKLHGSIVHPNTGELIYDYESKVCILFSLNRFHQLDVEVK